MRYTIDTKTNSRFIQFFGATEINAVNEGPLAFQVRASAHLLEPLEALLVEVAQRIQAIDANYHINAEARHAFEGGFVVFRPGEVPLTCVVQRRCVVLMVGNRTLGNSPIDLPALQAAVKKALAGKAPKAA